MSKFKSFLVTMAIIAISGALFVFWDRLSDCLEMAANMIDHCCQRWHLPQIKAQPLSSISVSLPQSADQRLWLEWPEESPMIASLMVSAEQQISVKLPVVKTFESSPEVPIVEESAVVDEESLVQADASLDVSEDVLESVDTSVDYNTQPDSSISVDTPATPTSSVASAEPVSDAPQPQPSSSVVSADPLPSPPQPQVTRPRPKLARPRPAYFVTVEAYDQNLDEYFYVIEAADGKTLQWREQVPGNYYFLFGPQIQVTAYKQGQVVTQISPLTHSVVISPETCDLITIKKVP